MNDAKNFINQNQNLKIKSTVCIPENYINTDVQEICCISQILIPATEL